MDALITGGSGYFGSLLMRKLREAGMRCRVFDLADTDDRPCDVEFFPGDIRDEQAIARACQGVATVYHNIAQVPLAKQRHLFESVNVSGTRNLLEAAAAAGVRKVVYTSSSAVFGVPRSNPVTEQTPPSPAEAYGRAKWQGEELCRQYARKGLLLSIIRPRTILGHGRLGIFQILFEWVYTGRNVPVLGAGDNIYQFVHADDLAGACILAAQRTDAAGEASVYNCGTDRYCTMRQTLQTLCDHARTGSKVVSVPMKPAVWGMKATSALGLSPLGAYHSLVYGRSLYFDIAKAQSELGWQPRYSNQEMIVESYQWYLQNRRQVLEGHGGSRHRSAVKQGVLKLVSWFL